jgi:hypothetical protein
VIESWQLEIIPGNYSSQKFSALVRLTARAQ